MEIYMRTTLQDIASRLGVTPSTVQRALRGAPGVSDKRRAEIIRVAKEMDYRTNFYASSLKKGAKRIAVLLPNRMHHNRYYADYIWQGIDQFMVEVSTLLNIELIRLPYASSPGEHNVLLSEVLSGKHGEIDGIITRGGSRDGALDGLYAQVHRAGIPFVLVGMDIENKQRLCCVLSCEGMQGRMAADLVTVFGSIQEPGKVILCGNLLGPDQYQNAKGFERGIWESGLPLTVHTIAYDQNPEQVMASISQELHGPTPVRAIYATSTRATIAMCKAVKEAGFSSAVRTIGSDIFAESARSMQEGTLSAILHSRPATMAYQAAQVLTSYLAYGDSPDADTISIDPCIIMRSNLGFYFKDGDATAPR